MYDDVIRSISSATVIQWGWALVHFTWQGLAVGLMALSVPRLLGSSAKASRTPAVRYRVLVGLFLLLSVMPLLTRVFLSANRPASVSASPAARVSADVENSGVARPRAVALPFSEDVPRTATVAHSAEPEPDFKRQRRSLPVAAVPRAVSASSGLSRFVARANDWMSGLVVLWLFGVALAVGRLSWAWWRLRCVVRGAPPVGPMWQRRADAVSRRLGLQSLRVLRSPNVSTPCVVGIWKPVVVLPTDNVGALSDDEIEALLVHECVHVRRRDQIVHIFELLGRTVWFFHPVVQWLARRIETEREYCCDDQSVALTGDPVRYAHVLLRAAEIAVEHKNAIALSASDGELLSRVSRLVGQSRPVSRRGRIGACGCAVASIVFTTFGFAQVGSVPITPSDRERQPLDDAPKSGSKAAGPRLGVERFHVGSYHVRFLPNGKSLVVALRATGQFLDTVGEGERPAALMDARTGRVLRKIGPPTTEDHVWSVAAISGDGRRIAYVRYPTMKKVMSSWSYPFGGPRTVEIRHTATDRVVCVLDGAHVGSSSSAFNADGTRFATCPSQSSRERDIEIWNAVDGKRLLTAKVQNRHSVDAVAVDESGQWVAIAGPGDVFLWDTAKNTMSVFEDRGATAVAFSPDGIHVGTGRGGAPEARLWQRTEAKGTKRFQFPVSGSRAVTFSPDGRRYIVPSGYGHKMSVFDVESGRRLFHVSTGGMEVTDVAVSPDSTRVAITGSSAGVVIFDLESGELLSRTAPKHEDMVRDLRFSIDGERILTAGMDGRIIEWKTRTREPIALLRDGSERWAGGVAYSTDGQFILAASLDDKNRVWSTRDGRLVRESAGHGTTGAVYSVASDGRRVVSGGVDQRLRSVDIASGRILSEFPFESSLDHVPTRLSSDATTLVVRTAKRLDVYDTTTGTKRCSIPHAADAFAVSPDGRLVSTCRAMFDARTGKERRSFGVDRGRDGAVAFSPDGEWIVATTRIESNFEGTRGSGVWIVEVGGGGSIRQRDVPNRIVAAAISSGGSQVAVASYDTSVLLWDVSEFLGE